MIRIVLPLPSGQDRLDQWAYTLHAWSWDDLVIWGSLSADRLPRPFRGFATTSATIDAFAADSTLVVLTGQDARFMAGDISLETYRHPLNATYIFGHDDAALDPDLFAGLAPDKVFIPQVAESLSMFSATAFAVTMWDRRLKANG